MACSIHHGRRNSMDIPPEIADLLIVKNEFIKLYERDHPELQQCLQNLHHIMETFEEDLRGSTEGSRNAGIGGIVGGSTMIAGVLGISGLALAPFTLGASLVAAGAVVGAGVVVGGAATVKAAVIKGEKSSSTKNEQLTKFKQNIETEVRKFEEKIKPMAEKMTDLNEQTEKIMRYYEKLQQDVGDVQIYVEPSNKHIITIEDLQVLIKEMSGIIFLIAKIAEMFFSVCLLFNMITVFENTRALNDMEKLSQRPIDQKVGESEMTSKAGKFVVGMRNVIHELQNITDNLTKAKDKMEDFEGTA
ncbi:hypothetical protein E1301_Tti015536 [Triplophysa tibetana]|uniref:Apolipoprotein L3 n=1 Tax=Triplophysa tibetana TaxID=1572043 RepID=A0A5A9N335_9TELE|nr:hypothetical protein E1301_Tti015536 [Triplophysa tibetana]